MRNFKKWISLILTALLLTGLFAFSAFAVDAGTFIPGRFDDVFNPAPENPPQSYTIMIPLVKEVVQEGSKAPGAQTFTFMLSDFGYSGELNYSVSGNSISTDGPGTYYGTMVITTDNEDMAWNLCEGFSISEVNGGARGWSYDTGSWELTNMSVYDDYVSYYPSYSGSHSVPAGCNGLYFCNSYAEEEAAEEEQQVTQKPEAFPRPQLNKTDHFAFIKGYDDGTFGPQRNMTRAEVATMFARLMVEQMEVGKTYPCSFVDVKPTDWYANAIGYLEEYRIINGYAGNLFKPNNPITRAEFAAIACRFEELTVGDSHFSDVPDSHWAAKYINYAATRGWVTGYTDGTFKPNKYITRAEVVTITCRLLERKADQDYVNANTGNLPREFKDTPTPASHWAYWSIMEAANGHDYNRISTGEQWTAVYK